MFTLPRVLAVVEVKVVSPLKVEVLLTSRWFSIFTSPDPFGSIVISPLLFVD